jgi:hypothetical protein
VSYFEDGTVKVSITGEYNKLVFDREVFGIKPEDLEECELPNDNELCGTLLTLKEDVEAFIHHIKNESHGH